MSSIAFVYKSVCKVWHLLIYKPFCHIITLVMFHGNNVHHGRFHTNGIPIIYADRKGGRITIGDNLRINNGDADNNIGYNSRCTLVAMNEAHLHVCDNVGMSQTALLNGDANNNGIHLILRTYDMPFFMLISGFFFSFSVQKYTLKTLVTNKITTILLPTIFWGLILSKFRDVDSFYFLWAVFLSALIIAVIQKAHLPSYSNIMIYGLILIILHIQPYSLWNLPYLFPYFVLGYYGVIIKKHYNVAWAIIVFVTCLCFWESSYTVWNAGTDILSGGCKLALILALRTIVAISGIIVIRELLDVLYRYLESTKKSWLDFVVLCGRNTLALYILHSIVLTYFVEKLVRIICAYSHSNPFNYNEKFLGYILAPLLALLVMRVLVQLILWCQNHKYTDKLFGFKIE